MVALSKIVVNRQRPENDHSRPPLIKVPLIGPHIKGGIRMSIPTLPPPNAHTCTHTHTTPSFKHSLFLLNNQSKPQPPTSLPPCLSTFTADTSNRFTESEGVVEGGTRQSKHPSQWEGGGLYRTDSHATAGHFTFTY